MYKFILALVVAVFVGSPAGAQVMTAGGDLDVYDDNGDIVGPLVALGVDGGYSISVEAPDGGVAIFLAVSNEWGGGGE